MAAQRRRFQRALSAVTLGSAIAFAVATPWSAAAQTDTPWTIAVFGGMLSTDPWEDVFIDPGAFDLEASALVGVAAARRVAQPHPSLDIEIEGQLVRHFGDQDHWEVNAPVIARWTAFPWDASVDTSAAVGLGLSAASRTPSAEAANLGESAPVLAYWMIELEAGAPESAYSGFARLHHRSTAFGLFNEDGGSNSLVLGVRRRF